MVLVMGAAFPRFCLPPAVTVMVVNAVTSATVVVVGNVLTVEETVVVVLHLSASSHGMSVDFSRS